MDPRLDVGTAEDGVSVTDTEIIDIRCPEDPRHLFLKLRRAGETPHVTDGNLIELACYECKKLRRKEDPNVIRVLHFYDLLGELIETKVETASPEEVERLRRRGVARSNPSR